MNEMIAKENPEKKERESFSISKEINGVKKTVRGREVENGWVISVDKEWQEKDENGDTRYEYDSKEYVTSKDPRKSEKQTDEEKAENEISELVNSIPVDAGSLMV